MNLSKRIHVLIVKITRYSQAILILGTLFGWGCKNSSVDAVSKSVEGHTTYATEQVANARQKVEALAQGEYEKLIKYEYKVLSLPGDLSDAELEQQLSVLGRERWNCFHAETQAGKTRFFCNRLPLTFLRLLPYLF
jgi:hypothetical protein